jgi:methylated-DNA-[protein]-cysteine S-methyltransferase
LGKIFHEKSIALARVKSMKKKENISREKTSRRADYKQQVKIETVIGNLYFVASKNQIFWISNKKNSKQTLLKNSVETFQIIHVAHQQLCEYFLKKRKYFEVPLKSEGTTFQQTVWREVSKIPYGQKMSYKELAKKINKPNASRAVGNAVANNPLCLLIPCHRVICSSGKTGQFSMGKNLKKYLLELESSRQSP